MFSAVKNWFRGLLIQSQEYTGTDNLYIAKQGFWSASGFGLNSLLSFATILAFANFIPKEIYGTYKYIVTLVGTLGFLMLSGMNTAVAQAVSRGQDRAFEYAVRIQLRWNLICMAAGLVMAGYYFSKGNLIFAICIAMLAIETPITAALNTYGPYLTGKKQFKRAALYTFISGLAYSACMLIAVTISDNLIILVAANALSSLIPMTLLYTYIQGSVRGPELSNDEKHALLRYSGHLSLINIIPTIAQSIDKIMVFQYVGPAALATYALAAVGPDRVKGWLKNIGGILFPKLAERSLEEIDSVFYIRTLQAMFVGFAAALAYSIAAPFVFRLFFPQYLDSVRYSQVLSLSLVGIAAAVYIGSVLTSQKILQIIYRGSPAVHGGKILLFVVMGYFWGIWGIILSTVFIQFFNTALHSFLWYWYVRRPMRAPS